MPDGTKNILVLLQDPVHVKIQGVWTHWILHGLSPDTSSLEEGLANESILPGVGLHADKVGVPPDIMVRVPPLH